MMKPFLITACIFGFLAVTLGAMGAHALKDRLTVDQLASWETGVRYQMMHALVLFAVAWLLSRDMPLAAPAGVCFMVGTLLFSGSIYLLCLGIGPRALLGPTTPLGGLTLMAGWVVLLVGVLRS